MNIRILDNAKFDLLEGYHFYEASEEHIGSYFLDCLYSDIDSLILYAGSQNERWFSLDAMKKITFCYLLHHREAIHFCSCNYRLSTRSKDN